MPNPKLSTIHLVFKTHLDVGFTDLAANVVSTYFERYIPAAIVLAQQLRETGSERFVWTTGSWLIYQYLEWASPSNRRMMERAIDRGDVVWHALPFTTHSEYLGRDLFAFGLTLSGTLDRRFGRTTIAGKMTDVPGHTRGIVPLLADAGIRFLHIGVNPASAPPQVPPVFTWRDPATNSSVVVMYQTDYGLFTLVPGMSDALSFEHTGDNHGPQHVADVRAAYGRWRKQYPGVRVRASTLDAYARRLLASGVALPVVTAEIGDSWISGVATDQVKTRQFRIAARLRAAALADGRARATDPRVQKFSRLLLAVGEHTWGMDLKRHLWDFTTYTNRDLAKARAQSNFQRMEASWQEQRQYITDAVAALGAQPLARAIRAALAAAEPQRPELSGFGRIRGGSTLETAHFRLRLDPHTGAVCDLQSGRRTFADPQHLLAAFSYESFCTADYDRYLRQYARDLERHRAWIVPDITKPGMPTKKHGRFLPRLAALHQRRHAGGYTVIATLAMPAASYRDFGAPRTLYLTLEFPDAAPTVSFDLQWFDKTASRLPEACWLAFNPLVRSPNLWRLGKLGQAIAPLDVVPDGGRHLHAVESGLTYAGSDGPLALDTFDAPVVAPGKPSLLDFNNSQPTLASGFHFLLSNNIWGTNFPMWTDDPARFRFCLRP